MDLQHRAKEMVVMFPFMAQGHMNPFLDLSRQLSVLTPALTITIISTPSNIMNLQPRFIAYPTITFISLPPFDETSENTDTLSSLKAISKFYHESEKLQPSFHSLMSNLTQSNNGSPPICVISDMFLGFTVDVAHEFGSRHVTFYTSGPYAMSIYNSIWCNLDELRRFLTSSHEDDVLVLPDFPPNVTIHRTQLSTNMKSAALGENQSSSFAKRQAEYCKRSDGSLWNTVEVLEKTSLEMWAKVSGKPVWAVGPLLPVSSKEFERGGKIPGLSPEMCIEWLNSHPPKSVVFVSFGSQNSVPIDQMKELAMGLERSGKGFIFVLRNPTGFDVTEDFRYNEWLPTGFKDRITETKQGLLVRNWAPQMEILSHESVGAFLSHCGWNSVLESLIRGVPIIGWPLGSEQHYNSKLLEEELGVCVEVARGFDAKIESSDLEKMVRLVVESDKGLEMRKKAESLGAEMKKAVLEVDGVKGSSLRALDDFINTMKRWIQSN